MNEILEKPNDKLICVDMDGTLCEGEFWHIGNEPTPIQKNIDFVNHLYQKGAHIIIWSARAPVFYPETHGWLISHQVKFHGIMMNKGGADLYIDDKCINIKDI